MGLPKEANTRVKIDRILINLGYNIDETKENANVFKEQAKFKWEQNNLNNKYPDYVIYNSETDKPLAVIETKKLGGNLQYALNQGIQYAKKISAPLVFATNDTATLAYHIKDNSYLKIDGVELQEIVDEKTLIRFVQEGSSITSNPLNTKYTKREIQKKFKKINNLLRQEGLRSGEERFSAIADLLFLKLISEDNTIDEIVSKGKKLPKKYQWDVLKAKKPVDMIDYLNDSIRKRLVEMYGTIFETDLKLQKPEILNELILEIDTLNLSDTDTDIKGDAFEFFLRNMTNENKDLGEYYTPRHIIKMILNILQPKYGDKIYDGFCGTGGFLIEAFKYLSLRSDISDAVIRKKLKTDTIFGSEITSTSRIAKMNMILYGDGHSNINKQDSLAHPINNKYDIAISNIPYSQKTNYSSLYNLSTNNADPVCVKYLWDSLKEGGKLAVIVPETFLYESGDTQEMRKQIYNNSSDLTIISLPRGVFNPYTPIKTSVIIATKKKSNQPKSTYFFIINQDGFELGARRRPLSGQSDLSQIKFFYEEKIAKPPQSCNVNIINDTYSFLAFDYMNDIPNYKKTVALRELSKEKNKIKLESILEKIDDTDIISILEISQKGIWVNKEMTKNDSSIEKYLKHSIVEKDDIVFNPHRINVGSIGKVYNMSKYMIVSPIYDIFRFNSPNFTNFYLQSLKSETYRLVLEHYAIGGARPLLNYSRLTNIELPVISEKNSRHIKEQSKKIDIAFENYINMQKEMNYLIQNFDK